MADIENGDGLGEYVERADYVATTRAVAEVGAVENSRTDYWRAGGSSRTIFPRRSRLFAPQR
ncbi:hypothetical protein GCM10009000_095910 [Halobacterium noricense]